MEEFNNGDGPNVNDDNANNGSSACCIPNAGATVFASNAT